MHDFPLILVSLLQYHHACVLFNKIYWVGLNSSGSRMVVDIEFTRGTVFATMSFHSG